MPSAGWRFSLDKGEWVEAEAASIKPFALGRPLRLATLNVLFDFDVEARIVRYEIRDLSDEDRELYLAALQTFYATSDEEGLKKYGSKFRSLEYLVRQHLYGAADKACDHCKKAFCYKYL